MSNCKFCGQSVEFRAHPLNATKLAPFNKDGEIHFATCMGKSKAKREYNSRDEILCKVCEEFPLFVYVQPTVSGDRLAVLCDQLHHTFIPLTEKNRLLVNAEFDQADMIRAIRNARYSEAYTPQQARAKQLRLSDEYRQRFTVTSDVGVHLR